MNPRKSVWEIFFEIDDLIRSSIINKEEIIWRAVRHFVEGKQDSGESEDYFSPVFKEDPCASLSRAEQVCNKDENT